MKTGKLAAGLLIGAMVCAPASLGADSLYKRIFTKMKTLSEGIACIDSSGTQKMIRIKTKRGERITAKDGGAIVLYEKGLRPDPKIEVKIRGSEVELGERWFTSEKITRKNVPPCK